MRPKRQYRCSGCQQKHEKPTGKNCPFMASAHEDDPDSEQEQQIDASDDAMDDIDHDITPEDDQEAQDVMSPSVSVQILQTLQSVDSRLKGLESRVDANATAIKKLSTGGARPKSRPMQTVPVSDFILPTAAALSQAEIQAQVDERVREVAQIQSSGRYKSQRGGSETVWVKKQVAWPQNHIRGGISKSRVSFDSLNVFQFVSGFAGNIRDEDDLDTKNLMLEYFSELFEDANDFSWLGAKGAHAELLCKMKEGRVEWHEKEKVDRVRRFCAQKPSNNHTQNQGQHQAQNFAQKQFGNKKKNFFQSNNSHTDEDIPIAVCKFYQTGDCHKRPKHISKGVAYHHWCLYCYARGQVKYHAEQNCRPKAQEQAAKNG